LADADAARDIARQAIAQSEKILRDAQESLKTLQGAHILTTLPIVLMLM
jgi:outer membrane protein TolC